MIASASSASGGYSDKIIAEDDLVFLGNGVNGVDCFDAGSGTQPSLLSSVDTPGEVKKLAYANKLLAIADGVAGITVIDFSDPGSPILLGTHETPSPAISVALGGGIAFAGLEDGTIISMDARQGYPIDQVSFAEADNKREVEDLVFFDGVLYAIIDAPWYWTWGSWRSYLKALPCKSGIFHDITGQLHSGNFSIDCFGYRPYRAGRRLFVGEDYVYVQDIQGFNYISLVKSNRIEAQKHQTASIGWRRLSANGSGLILSAEAATYWRSGDISLYTVKSDGSFLRPGGYLENFEATFPTPGDARDVAVYNGLAYVADGSQGLQVLAYRSYETGDVPPELEVRSNDLNGSAEEGSTFVLRAVVSDDIQVKNVDFWINDELIKVDGGYPFSLAYKVPLLTEATEFSAQIIARDTGGNEVRSETLTFFISEDATPPVVAAIYPSDDSVVRANDPVLVLFSEDLDPDTVADGLIFENLAALGTSIPLLDLEYDDTLFGIRATLPDYIAPGQYRLSVKDSITDLAGNHLGASKTRYLHGPSEVHGTVWFDSDHDGKRLDNESLLEGWSVFLDLDFNGEFSEGEPITTSDASGAYSFIDLLPGSYSVNERIPHQWLQTFPGNALGGELDPTRAFDLGGLMPFYNSNLEGEFPHFIDGSSNHWAIIQTSTSSFQYQYGISDHLIRKYSPGGKVLHEENLQFSHSDSWNTTPGVMLAQLGHNEPIAYLAGISDNDWTNFNSNLLESIVFNLPNRENNETYDLPIAYSLSQENSRTIGISKVDANSSVIYLRSQPGKDGDLYLATVFDGSLQIGNRTISESRDNNYSLLLARIDENLALDFTTQVEISTDLFNASRIEGLNLDIQFATNSKSIFKFKSILSGYDPVLGRWNYNMDNESVYLVDKEGSVVEHFETNGSLSRASLTEIAQLGFLTGWSAYTEENASGSLKLKAIRFSNQGDILNDISLSEENNEFLFQYSDLNGNVMHVLNPETIDGTTVHEIQSLSPSNPQIDKLVKVEKTGFSYDYYHNQVNSGFALVPSADLETLWFFDNHYSAYNQSSNEHLIKVTSSNNSDRLSLGSQTSYTQFGSYFGKISEDGKVHLGKIIDFSANPGIASYLSPIVPLFDDEGAWIFAYLDNTDGNYWEGREKGEKTDFVEIGPSLIEFSGGTQVAIRIGGPAAENHMIDLPVAESIIGVDFGNALPLDERKSVTRFGGSQDDQVRNLSTDYAGNLFLAGSINGRGDYEGEPLSGSQNDAILSKYAPGGQLLWSLRFGGNADDLAHDARR